jgi:hypothetical protein
LAVAAGIAGIVLVVWEESQLASGRYSINWWIGIGLVIGAGILAIIAIPFWIFCCCCAEEG